MSVQELIALLQKLPPDFTVGQLCPDSNLILDEGDVLVSEIGVVFDAQWYGYGLDNFQPIEQWLEANANG